MSKLYRLFWAILSEKGRWRRGRDSSRVVEVRHGVQEVQDGNRVGGEVLGRNLGGIGAATARPADEEGMRAGVELVMINLQDGRGMRDT